jgi:hypothetical protein
MQDEASWWCRVYDPASASYYYYHTSTYEVTWDTPPGFDLAAAQKRERDAAGLGLGDAPHGLAMLLAARKLQAAFRARQARKVADEMRSHAEAAQNGWSAVYDSNSAQYYYWNLTTQEVTYDKPPGFDLAKAKRRERDAAGLSLSDAEGGLALLIATRKIQAVYRAKQARRRMRSKRAESAIGDLGDDLDADIDWIKVMDPGSGYPYWYHRESHEVTWDEPTNPALDGDGGDDGDDKEQWLSRVIPDDYCFQPRRAALPFVAEFLNDIDLPLQLLAKCDLSGKLLPLTKSSRAALRHDSHGSAVDFGPLISCGTLMALRIRGTDECEMTGPALDALRILSGHPAPVPDLSSRPEKRLTKGLKLYRGNRRWLQKHRRGLLSKMCDFEFLRRAEALCEKAEAHVNTAPEHIARVREFSTSGAALHEWLRVVFAGLRGQESKKEEVEEAEEAEDDVSGAIAEELIKDAVKNLVFKVCEIHVLKDVKDAMDDILSRLASEL